MRNISLTALIVIMSGAAVSAEVSERPLMQRVLLTTDARQITACERLGAASDTSLGDLRKKIVRRGGDAGLLTFDPDDLDKVHADVYRCQKPAPPAVTAAPAAAGPTSIAATPVRAVLAGTWTGTVAGPLVVGGGGARQPVPATVRVWEEGGELRWKMDVTGADLSGSGTVVERSGDISFTGTYGGQALSISYSLTVRGQALEGFGAGADNIVRTLSLRKQP